MRRRAPDLLHMVQDAGSQGRGPPHLRVTVGVAERRQGLGDDLGSRVNRGAHRQVDDATWVGLCLGFGVSDGVPREDGQTG